MRLNDSRPFRADCPFNSLVRAPKGLEVKAQGFDLGHRSEYRISPEGASEERCLVFVGDTKAERSQASKSKGFSVLHGKLDRLHGQ